MGLVSQHILDSHHYEQKIHDLLGLEDDQKLYIRLNIDLNDSVQQDVNEDSGVQAALQNEPSDLRLYRFVLDCFDELDAALRDCEARLPQDLSNYLQCDENYAEMLNLNKRFFLMDQQQTYNNYNVDVCREQYRQYLAAAGMREQPCVVYGVPSLLAAPALLGNHFDLAARCPHAPANFVVLGRLRGLKIAYELYHGRLSPDDGIVQADKNHGFVSEAETLRCYVALQRAAEAVQAERQDP